MTPSLPPSSSLELSNSSLNPMSLSESEELMEENVPLFSLSNFKCECLLGDAVNIVGTHLTRTRKLLDSMENGNEKTRMKKTIASIQRTVDELKRQSLEHLTFRSDYAREYVELDKERRINTIRTLSYATGKERGDEEKAKITSLAKDPGNGRIMGFVFVKNV